jgi:cyclopropane-fatty-acyl-phospholipid synthase
LGTHLKSSSCQPGTTRLDAAERDMLELTCQRARSANGARILELGCCWGSLTLFIAQRFPNARIIAVSNSRTQKQFVAARERTQARMSKSSRET